MPTCAQTRQDRASGTYFLGSQRRGSETRSVRSYCSSVVLISVLLLSSTSAWLRTAMWDYCAMHTSYPFIEAKKAKQELFLAGCELKCTFLVVSDESLRECLANCICLGHMPASFYSYTDIQLRVLIPAHQHDRLKDLVPQQFCLH